MAAGCTQFDRRLHYFGKAELTEYEPVQLRIESPEATEAIPEAAAGLLPPRTIADRSRDATWDMTLAEAIQLSLVNNRVARTRNDFLSPGNTILQNSEGVVTVYDPAIRETGVLFGTRGVESALSAFDPLFQTNLSYGNADTIQNNPIASGGIPEGRTLKQEISQFTTGISKTFAYGAQVGVSQNWNYTHSNQLFQLFPSVFTGNLQFNYAQPLWAGSGTEYTRIAGPLNTNVQGLSGVNQGVIIARINTDISLAEFEQQVRLMVFDVETLYWDLYQAYRNYDSLVLARDAALKTWRTVQSKSRSGLVGGGKAEEAQAREAYYEARARAETARGGPAGRGGEQGILGLELQLRRICGLPSNDGRVIRPIDDPSLSQIVHDWHSCLATAFARRSELRKQRWIVKSNELQLRAAKSQAAPQLNLISSYQLNGFGNHLFGPNGEPGTTGAELQSAYRTQFQGDQTSWNVGVQFSAPLGLRNALVQVRNHELRVIKSQAVLATQEIEVSHELAGTFQAVEYWYQNMETNYNRREAAMQNIEAVQT
ncbi:MAG: TolC family protein, partial [Planctomycetaceae bacterium]